MAGRSVLEGAAITVATFLVLLASAPDGLWLDESISVRIAALPLPTFARFVAGGEPNMALFHALLWPVAQAHPSDTVLRVLPMAAASLALGATYLLGCRVFNRPTAAVAVALLAVHGLASRYASEVRGYSLLVLLTVVCALALIEAVESDRAWAWRLFTVCAVLGLATHFVAVLTIGAQLVALLVVRERVDGRRLARTLVVLAAGLAVFAVAWVVGSQGGRVSWIPPLSGQQVLDVVKALGGGSVLAAALVGALAAFASWSVLRARSSEQSFPGILLVCATWLPLLGGLIVSVAQPIFLPRYYVAVLPPLALLVARALFALPRRPVLGVAAAAMVLAAVLVGRPNLDRNTREGTDDAVAYLMPRLRPGDAIFLPYNEELPALQWYGDDAFPPGVVDARPGTPPDALTSDWWWEDPDRFGSQLAAAARLPEADWAEALQDQDRVWVLSGFLADDPRFHDSGSDEVPQGRVECDRQFFRGIDVVLWARSCD
jgi:hypothetical protein